MNIQTALLPRSSSGYDAATVPTGLTATAISSTQINLAWTASTDNVGVTGYRVYRGTTLIATVTATSYSDTGSSFDHLQLQHRSP